MNQLIIPTPFEDVSQLTDNFATRVDETPQIMLPYHEPVADGEWFQFAVQLADGTVALEGVGRSTGTQDNGEEYPPEYRYDVVLDSLQFEGMSEVMFERILQARASQLEGDPGTGEVDVNQLAAPADDGLGEVAEAPAPPHDLPTEAVPLEPSAPMQVPDLEESPPADELPAEASLEQEGWVPEPEGFVEAVPTQAVQLEDLEPAPAPSARPAAVRPAAPAPSAPPASARSASPPLAARPSPPQRPRGALPLLHTFTAGILTRPTMEPSWSPEPTPRPEAAQSSGFFDYQGGLPRPASPPRPEIADEQRVVAAPSPMAPWSRASEAAQLH
ncbi:MAG: hypothetical protein OHK0013_47380 [Sandaracinaceae bacterium]